MQIKWLFIAALVVALLVTGWKVLLLENDLAAERHAHAQTQTALAAALVEGQRWRTVAAEYQTAADAQQRLAESCLSREAQAQTDAQARKTVLATAKPHPRTMAEKQQVVDDATRKAVAARLNRGL